MKDLYLDIGNTRTKYRILSGQHGPVKGISKTADLHLLVYNGGFDSVFISSVADVAVRQRLSDLLKHAGVKKVFWAETKQQYGDVINAYQDYQQLGVDRWLAIIAAFYKCRKACCVFDFGSAVTVDFVDERGCHTGGYIVPGSGLCIASLKQNTAALKPAPKFSQTCSPGTNTETCIQNGIYLQQAGFAKSVLEGLGSEFIICTGGGFAQVEKVFSQKEFNYIPELVLDGLEMVSQVRSP